MFTPYDWQEGIGHRAQFCLSRLEAGVPVLMVSLDAGILAFSVRRQARKIYEIYNHLMFSAIGQQSDIESIRVAAIDFAHQEGFNRSERDVTIQRIVSYLSQPLKKAFADFQTSPFVARSLFAEAEKSHEEDSYYVLDYDGDFSVRKNFAYLSGNEDANEGIREGLGAIAPSTSPTDAIEALKPIWAKAVDLGGGKNFTELTVSLTPEAALLSRGDATRNFTLLDLS